MSTPNLTTNNPTGGLSGAIGSFFGGIRDLAVGVAPLARDLYVLRLQEDSRRDASVPAAVPAPATSADTGGGMKPWMLWTGVGLILVVIVALVRRR
ncbi:MAG TPA: hypothetical protein VEB66_02325 [Opitutaceae bacterium]|nr:hypothetical protein [Opitutaceae bacterium]